MKKKGANTLGWFLLGIVAGVVVSLLCADHLIQIATSINP